MNKKKNDVWNLIFSAFLVTAFLICASFFIGMINDSFAQDNTKRILMLALVFVLFGLLLFYATRVGDGKQVIRFSPATLILMVLPALYVIIASAAAGWPFHDVISQRSELVNIAAVILGYGIPYTFISGYELKPSEKEPSAQQEDSDTDHTVTDNSEKNTIETNDTAVSEDDTSSDTISEDILDNFSDDTSDEES